MMGVLICGAQGFIGRHLVAAFEAAGHQVIRGVRTEPATDLPDQALAHAWVRIDFADAALAADQPAEKRCLAMLHCLSACEQRYGGVDVVVNAVGVLRDSASQPLEQLHHLAPAALFEACAALGVRRVLQISALGIDNLGTGADSAQTDRRGGIACEGEVTYLPYAHSKALADQALIQLTKQQRLDGVVLRPSLVYGPAGASAQLFDRLAQLPVLWVPQPVLDGRVQPVDVRDLADLVVRLATDPQPPRQQIVPVVGPLPMTLIGFIAHLRAQQARPAAVVWRLPDALTAASIWLGDRLPLTPWGATTAALLGQTSQAEVAPVRALLGRPLRVPGERVANAPRLWQSVWLSLVFVWLISGLLSLLTLPTHGMHLLHEAGMTDPLWMQTLIVSGAALDIVLGLVLWRYPSARSLQLCWWHLLGMTLVATALLPSLWLHPLGPVLKNLPLLLCLRALMVGLPAAQPCAPALTASLRPAPTLPSQPSPKPPPGAKP